LGGNILRAGEYKSSAGKQQKADRKDYPIFCFHFFLSFLNI